MRCGQGACKIALVQSLYHTDLCPARGRGLFAGAVCPPAWDLATKLQAQEPSRSSADPPSDPFVISRHSHLFSVSPFFMFHGQFVCFLRVLTMWTYAVVAYL